MLQVVYHRRKLMAYILIAWSIFEFSGIIIFRHWFIFTGFLWSYVMMQVILSVIFALGIYCIDSLLLRYKCNNEFLIKELRSQSRIIAEIKHDIRSPVSGIHQMSRAICSRLNDHELKRLTQLIVDSSGNILKAFDH